MRSRDASELKGDLAKELFDARDLVGSKAVPSRAMMGKAYAFFNSSTIVKMVKEGTLTEGAVYHVAKSRGAFKHVTARDRSSSSAVGVEETGMMGELKASKYVGLNSRGPLVHKRSTARSEKRSDTTSAGVRSAKAEDDAKSSSQPSGAPDAAA